MPGWLIWLIATPVLLALLWWQLRRGLRLMRRQNLLSRFDDPAMVDTILEGRIAQGMTAEMVVAVWGEPEDLDETVMKTKRKTEMKYNQTGKNRFGTRVHLEDGIVVGWEVK
jgi:hypothetical protein